MMMNQFNWSQDKELRDWIKNNRLDGFTQLIASVDKTDNEKMAVMSRIQQNAMPAMAKLQQFTLELAEGVKR
jgi:hypothetical protein